MSKNRLVRTNWDNNMDAYALAINEVIGSNGARPTNGISIELENRSKLGVHNEITLLWLVQKVRCDEVYCKPEHCKFWSNFEFEI